MALGPRTSHQAGRSEQRSPELQAPRFTILSRRTEHRATLIQRGRFAGSLCPLTAGNHALWKGAGMWTPRQLQDTLEHKFLALSSAWWRAGVQPSG